MYYFYFFYWHTNMWCATFMVIFYWWIRKLFYNILYYINKLYKELPILLWKMYFNYLTALSVFNMIKIPNITWILTYFHWYITIYLTLSIVGLSEIPLLLESFDTFIVVRIMSVLYLDALKSHVVLVKEQI